METTIRISEIGNYLTALEDSELIKGTDMNAAILSEAPQTCRVSNYCRDIQIVNTDDAAMIGEWIHCVDCQSGDDEIRRAMEGRKAVLLAGIGGVCVGRTMHEAKAACACLENSCRIAAEMITEESNHACILESANTASPAKAQERR